MSHNKIKQNHFIPAHKSQIVLGQHTKELKRHLFRCFKIIILV